jgi:hypothetical protein
MKPIELTEKHKEKLLEMCRILFPEYKYWNLHNGTCDLCMENTLDYSTEEKPKWNSWNRIHWFEFCMTHLCDKIKSLNGFNDDYDCDTNLMSCWFESHPIDYLYEEFKKLNNKVEDIDTVKVKPSTENCGFEGCDNYKWDHICRCK